MSVKCWALTLPSLFVVEAIPFEFRRSPRGIAFAGGANGPMIEGR